MLDKARALGAYDRLAHADLVDLLAEGLEPAIDVLALLGALPLDIKIREQTDSGKPTVAAIFSLEMSRNEIAMRLLSAEASIAAMLRERTFGANDTLVAESLHGLGDAARLKGDRSHGTRPLAGAATAARIGIDLGMPTAGGDRRRRLGARAPAREPGRHQAGGPRRAAAFMVVGRSERVLRAEVRAACGGRLAGPL